MRGGGGGAVEMRKDALGYLTDSIKQNSPFQPRRKKTNKKNGLAMTVLVLFEPSKVLSLW